LTDVNQTLAAEPGYHSDPPRRGGFEVTAVRRVSDHRSELLEQQPKNVMALAYGPVPVLGVVVKDGAGGAALEAAPGLVVEIVGGEFHQQGKIFWVLAGGMTALIQRRFQVADAFFLRAIVTRITGWMVQGQHAEAGQDRIQTLEQFLATSGQGALLRARRYSHPNA